MRRQTSKPSISGIITSSRMMSGGDCSILASASGPFSASSTSKYSAESLASRSRRLAATSSTTRTRPDIARPALPQEPFDGAQELSHRDRLGDVGLATALKDLLFVALHGEGRHRDDRDRTEIVVLLDPLRDLQ